MEHRKQLDEVLTPEMKLWRETDVQQLSAVKEEVPPEQQECSSSLDQEDPEPPHIKEEQEELWISQGGEQLQGHDITKFPFTSIPVKSEDDEEKPQSSQMETEANTEDCGGPEPDRSSHPDTHFQPDSDFWKGTRKCPSGIGTRATSESETDDSDDWKETREPQSGLRSVKNEEVPVSESSCHGVTVKTVVSSTKPAIGATGERLYSLLYDVQQLSVVKEEGPPEQQECSSSLDQDPEPPHIKEEQEELWSSQEGEQLQGLEEADITKFPFTPVPVKSEDDEEKPQSAQMETEADGEDCGGPGPGPDRNSHPDTHVTPETEDKTGDSSEPETDDSDDWTETREPQSGSDSLKDDATFKDNHLKIHRRNRNCTGEEHFPEAGSLSQHVVVQREVKQEQPEPPHIKEEQEELWISQEGEQLQGLEEADITKFTFTPVPVKSEDDEEKPQSSQMETEADGEDCGGPGPDRNSHPDTYFQPDSDSVDSDFWKETRKLPTGLKSVKDVEVLKSVKDVEVPVSDSRRSVGGKPFSCSECGKRFLHERNLKIHMRTHTGERPFSCSVCKKSYTENATLQRHMKIHTGERPFSCSVCKKSYTENANLQRHMKIHTGEKPFSCSVCKKSFTLNHILQRHLKIHTGEKPFKCSTCDKRFLQKGSLKEHMKIHTGEKRFSCSFCKKSFSRNTTLQSHLKIHTGEKPFSCSVCDKRFPRKDSLKDHMRTHTGEKLLFVRNPFTVREHSLIQSDAPH